LGIKQSRAASARLAAAIGAVLAFALVPFTPAGLPVIAAALACLVGWRRA